MEKLIYIKFPNISSFPPPPQKKREQIFHVFMICTNKKYGHEERRALRKCFQQFSIPQKGSFLPNNPQNCVDMRSGERDVGGGCKQK